MFHCTDELQAANLQWFSCQFFTASKVAKDLGDNVNTKLEPSGMKLKYVPFLSFQVFPA
jgi:hypothetical protein